MTALLKMLFSETGKMVIIIILLGYLLWRVLHIYHYDVILDLESKISSKESTIQSKSLMVNKLKVNINMLEDKIKNTKSEALQWCIKDTLENDLKEVEDAYDHKNTVTVGKHTSVI